MLTILGSPRRFCDGITRRDLLQAGGLSVLGSLLKLPDAQAAEDVSTRAGKARSVISIFLHGGAATQDMVDLKPDAPIEVRGEFKPIATNVPGIRICEHLPLTAKWMHRAAIVRSVHHKSGCHNTLPAFTGCEMPVPDQSNANPNHPPSMGAVCEYLKATSGRLGDDLPAYACLPHHLGWGESGRRPGIYAGFLGQRYDPFCAECSPFIDKTPKDYTRAHPAELRGEPRIPNGVLSEDLTLDRLNHRQSLLQQLDGQLRLLDAQPAIHGYDRTRQRAFSLLSSARLKATFDLSKESPQTRDRYGRSLFGSSLLVARKLVEAGTRFINVFWDNYNPRLSVPDFGWDTHEVNFITLRDHYLPWLDRCYTALLEDLESRGLLDETLVVIMSDFGRTPRVNKDAGRDHWTYCYSVLFAGAGIRGGTVCGASDAHAAFIKDRPAGVADIAATIYDCLGIDPETLIHDRAGRPLPIAHGGQPIREILA